MNKRKNIYIGSFIAATVLGLTTAVVSESRFRKKTRKELSDIRMFQNMENEFFNHHSKRVAEELEEIRDEIGTVYGHLEEMSNIRKCGR